MTSSHREAPDGADSPMRITLSDERRKTILAQLQEFHQELFDEELSEFRAERILAFFLKKLGPTVYNQAIGDARSFMHEKLDDLDVEFYESEEPT